MALDLSGLVHLVIMGLTDHVFGDVMLTCVFIMLLFVTLGFLIRIPAPFALVIPLPIAIVFAAYGYMSVLAAGLLASGFLVIAVVSFLSGMGNSP